MPCQALIIGNIELSDEINYDNRDATDNEEARDDDTSKDEDRDPMLCDDNLDAEENELRV